MNGKTGVSCSAMATRIPSLRVVGLAVAFMAGYHFLFSFLYALTQSPRTARTVLDTEKLQYISRHLRHLYSLRPRLDRLVADTNSSSLRQLLQGLHALEEVVDPWGDTKVGVDDSDQVAVGGKVLKAVEVCPEVYMGATYGEPFYDKGFETVECDSAIPLRNLLTVLLDYHDKPSELLSYGVPLMKAVATIYPGLPVLAAIPMESETPDLRQEDGRSLPVTLMKVASFRGEGDVWNDLISNVQTKYVLVGKGLTHFDSDARLERLVRELSLLDVPIIGGAVKSPEGHWSLSCHQTSHRNYTLSYTPGYHHSLHGCVRCDFISGPFVATTRILRRRRLDRNTKNLQVFDDLFLRLKRARIQPAVCPDVMFHHHPKPSRRKRSSWLAFARKWTVSRIISEQLDTMSFSCSELGIACGQQQLGRRPWTVVPPCCLEQLAKIVTTIMSSCEQVGIHCQMGSSSLLGTVKFGKMLPWQRDAEIIFLSSNYSAFKSLEPILTKEGLTLTAEQATWCCKDGHRAGGAFNVTSRSSSWVVRLVGQYLLHPTYRHANMEIRRSQRQTLLAFAGHWLPAPRNPGLFVRNKYGPEVFRHDKHWLETGRLLGWAKPIDSSIPPCPQPGDHDCLDQWSHDGSLQFG